MKFSTLEKQGTNEPSVDELAIELLDAKAVLSEAKKAVEGIEITIVDLLGRETEGVSHFRGDKYTISTTGKLTRSLDLTELDANAHSLDPRILNELIVRKPTLSVKGFKKLAVSNPAAYKLACKFVTSIPAKTSVTVEEVKS